MSTGGNWIVGCVNAVAFVVCGIRAFKSERFGHEVYLSAASGINLFGLIANVMIIALAK